MVSSSLAWPHSYTRRSFARLQKSIHRRAESMRRHTHVGIGWIPPRGRLTKRASIANDSAARSDVPFRRVERAGVFYRSAIGRAYLANMLRFIY